MYVGSTKNTLRHRWATHKKLYQTNEHIAIYQHMREHGIDQFKIVLIKQYEVSDRKHLQAYEQLWINKLNSCNKIPSFQPLLKQSKHDSYWKRKEYYNEKGKQWYEANKEQYNQDRSKAIECECGLTYTHNHKQRHLATKRHLDRINGTTITTDRKVYCKEWQHKRYAYQKELTILRDILS